MNELWTSNAATLAYHISLSSHFVFKSNNWSLVNFHNLKKRRKKLPKESIFWFWFDAEKKKKIVPAFRSKQGFMIHSEPETHFGNIPLIISIPIYYLHDQGIPNYFISFFFIFCYPSYKIGSLFFSHHFVGNHWMKKDNKSSACSRWRDFFLLIVWISVSCLYLWNNIPFQLPWILD